MASEASLLDKITAELQNDHHVGIMLVAQMGMTPEEIQLVVQTAYFDENDRSMTTTGGYIVRCLGVQEHRISLGIFHRLVYVDDHPLLWNFNSIYRQIYFRGTPENVDSLMLDLQQLYGQHYGLFRSLADDINRTRPLGSLLTAGYGLLGEMPAPMAERIKTVLERYGLTVDLVDSDDHEEPPMQFKLLVLDDSYFVLQLVSIDLIKDKNSPPR